MNFSLNPHKPKGRPKPTEYKNVKEIYVIRDGSTYYRAKITVNKVRISFWGRTAKAVALELDKKLIEKGYEPTNILKRKI